MQSCYTYFEGAHLVIVEISPFPYHNFFGDVGSLAVMLSKREDQVILLHESKLRSAAVATRNVINA